MYILIFYIPTPDSDHLQGGMKLSAEISSLFDFYKRVNASKKIKSWLDILQDKEKIPAVLNAKHVDRRQEHYTKINVGSRHLYKTWSTKHKKI